MNINDNHVKLAIEWYCSFTKNKPDKSEINK